MSKDFEKHKITALSDESNKTIFHSWTHLSDKMIKVQETVSEAMELNDFNLNDKCLAASKLVGNFIASYYGEKRLLEKLEEKKVEVEKDYITNNIKKGKPTYKLEDEIANSTSVRAVVKAIKDQKDLVYFMGEHLKNLKQFSYNIKSATDLAKMEG